MDPLQSHAQQQQQAPVQRAEPAWLALNLLKSGDHDACIELCDRLLARSPSNKVTTRCASRHDMPMCDHNRRSGTSRPARSPSATGCRTMTMRKRCETMQYARHSLLHTQGVADILLDDNAMAALPRPGTSLARPATQQRPTTSRPGTGFLRPGTSLRPPTNARPATRTIVDALKTGRPTTTRPVTASGRYTHVLQRALVTTDLQDITRGHGGHGRGCWGAPGCGSHGPAAPCCRRIHGAGADRLPLVF